MNALFAIVRAPVEGKILRYRNGLRDLSPANAAKQRFLSYTPTDLWLLPPVNSSCPNELRRQEIIEWE
jgi:hypothetical protein